MASTVKVVEYLFTRLHQLGVRALHGVPGDYNLVALDYVKPSGLTWVGNANELNAGYAADGYARVKGMGAVITTFGVGELSAINAIAGSYAEYVPVVHIVGTPSTSSQKAGMILHHTLGNGDFRVFGDIFERVTCAQCRLQDPKVAGDAIDEVLIRCWKQSRPVYIEIPTDIATQQVDANPLRHELDLESPTNNQEMEEHVVQEILKEIERAKQPIILVDACVSRHRMIPQVMRLIRASGLPTFVSPMAKGCIDENLPNFSGVYAGDGSFDSVRRFVEDSDLVLSLGAIKSDFNTTGFTYRISTLRTIDFHSDFILKGYARYEVHMQGVISRLADALDSTKLSANLFKGDKIRKQADKLLEAFPDDVISHAYLWDKLSTWLQSTDVLIAETGTSYMGVCDTRFPPDLTFISQTLWGSIGYCLAAAEGASIACREIGRNQRVILFEGDGSFQLTAQSISTMLRNNLDLIVFLINNDGYGIERWVHGMEAEYNDIPMWKYADIPKVFGGTTKNAKSWIIESRQALEALWEDQSFLAAGRGLKFVELRMPKFDAPVTLKMAGAMAAQLNTKD